MKSIKDLPLVERRHFMKCSCGHYFDMRDLNDVIRHLHKTKAKASGASFSHSVKVGEPVAYKKKKRIGLN
jgi:hypothetical protein